MLIAQIGGYTNHPINSILLEVLQKSPMQRITVLNTLKLLIAFYDSLLVNILCVFKLNVTKLLLSSRGYLKKAVLKFNLPSESRWLINFFYINTPFLC